MNPVWVAMGLSFQTVKKWLHDRGEPSCSGGRRGQVNWAGLRAGAKLRPPPPALVCTSCKIFPPSADRLKRESHGHGKARQAHSLFNGQN